MTHHPCVSFVVPCFNYGRFLPDCLRGIFQQTADTTFEVIAIDDCSSDDTWKILSQWNDSRLVIVRHGVNLGHVATVNEGLRLASGEFIARIDPDDRYHSNFLTTLLPLFNDPEVGFAYGDAAMINAAGEITAPRCPQPHGGEPWSGRALLEILRKNYICAPTAIGRREAWLKHVPIWEGLAFNDIYFNVMIARDWKFAYVPEVVADYRVHGSNHHAVIAVSRSEEPSIMRVLDWVFTNREMDKQTEALKQRRRNELYGAHYLDLADKYFGAGLTTDARRCYWRAFIHSPLQSLKVSTIRRFLATLISVGLYNRSKYLAKRFTRPKSTHSAELGR